MDGRSSIQNWPEIIVASVNVLNWHRTLPSMLKVVGRLDNYNRGQVIKIDFISNFVVIVWVQYKGYSKAYKYIRGV